ncbi:MAG TPA: hypothetical protein VGE77_14050 [Nocardioides sp.]
MRDGRPTWLTEPCPAWCRNEHHEDDHPEDRVHRGDVAVVPAVVARWALPTQFHGELTELLVHRVQPVSRFSGWLVVQEAEGQEHRLVVHEDSVAALAASLSAFLAAAPSPRPG